MQKSISYLTSGTCSVREVWMGYELIAQRTIGYQCNILSILPWWGPVFRSFTTTQSSKHPEDKIWIEIDLHRPLMNTENGLFHNGQKNRRKFFQNNGNCWELNRIIESRVNFYTKIFFVNYCDSHTLTSIKKFSLHLRDNSLMCSKEVTTLNAVKRRFFLYPQRINFLQLVIKNRYLLHYRTRCGGINSHQSISVLQKKVKLSQRFNYFL